jgi:hypothetical protein
MSFGQQKINGRIKYRSIILHLKDYLFAIPLLELWTPEKKWQNKR